MSDKLTLDELRAKVAESMGKDRFDRMVDNIDRLANWPSEPIIRPTIVEQSHTQKETIDY